MRLLISGDAEMTADQVARIRAETTDIEVVWAQTAAQTAAAIASADVFAGLPSAAEFAAATRLKWLQYPGAGVEKLWKIPSMATSEIIVTNAGGVYAETMAEYTLGMVLHFCRAFPTFAAMQQKRHWGQDRGRSRLREAKGLSLGIIGLGQAGHAIAQRAKAFGMKVLAITPSKKEKPASVDALWGIDQLDALLQQSDFVVLAVAQTDKTTKMIGAAQLAQMKPTAYLINICRGTALDQQALVDALLHKRLAGAALDVFVEEPLPETSPLWQVENLFITPHIAGDSQQHRQRVIDLLIENLRRFQAGQPLLNQVDKQRGY